MEKDRGRPPVKPMPERIDATPEDIAERFLSLPADYQWQYEQDEKTEPTQPASPGFVWLGM